MANANADLEQFAYVASHDLREPLRMVSSYMALLERRYGNALNAEAHEFIAFAKEGAIRMNSLVLDLLEYSRIGRIADPLTPTRLADLVAEAINNLHVLIEDTQAEIRVCNELPVITCSGNEFIRMLQNLIGNAIKFNNKTSKPLVKISCDRQNDEWLLSVSDNGIGIDPAHSERIFMIFQRLHTRDKYDGTGIGLAVCKKVVELHGGKIWLESTPGQGSTFFFTIPVTPAGELSGPPAASSSSPWSMSGAMSVAADNAEQAAKPPDQR